MLLFASRRRLRPDSSPGSHSPVRFAIHTHFPSSLISGSAHPSSHSSPISSANNMPKAKSRLRTKKIAVRKSTAMSSIQSTDTTTDTGTGPIYFWREYGSKWGFLSQWYESPFHTSDKSITYQTAEQYMMYQKAVLFNDPETGAEILATTSPKEQKALGRRVQNFDNDVWLKERERIVGEGSYWKFVNSLKEGEDLKAMLLETGERELVEASPMDKIWGIGFGAKNAESQRHRWGLNLLGKALMGARKRIREEMGKEKENS
jgi:ribA/ribD-fused uncharacterized protein